MHKIDQFLKKDKTQRISYSVLLICWIVIFLNADTRHYITSYADYLPLIFIIPVLLLVLQVLFNNRILWTIILVCIIAYTIWTFVKIFTYIVVDQHRTYVNGIEWNAETILRFGCIAVILIAINWFIFKLKPLKSDGRITPNQL